MKAYLLTFLLGVAICWGVMASLHNRSIRTWQDAVAVEQQRTLRADSLRVEEAKARTDLLARWNSIRPVDTLPLVRARTLAQQEARRALDSAKTTSDSLHVVQRALVAAEGREQAVLDSLGKMNRSYAALRAEGLAQFARDSKTIADLTAERDRWKELAVKAPVQQKGPSRTLVALATAVVVLVVK